MDQVDDDGEERDTAPGEELREERRKCRADANQMLWFGLSSQLLLTFSRPSFQLSSTRLPSAVCSVPLPIHSHCGLSMASLSAELYSGAPRGHGDLR